MIGILQKLLPKKGTVVRCTANEKGLVPCDKVTVLFGTGLFSRTYHYLLPHDIDQDSADVLLDSAEETCEKIANAHFQGNWQIIEVDQVEATPEQIRLNYVDIDINVANV